MREKQGFEIPALPTQRETGRLGRGGLYVNGFLPWEGKPFHGSGSPVTLAFIS